MSKDNVVIEAEGMRYAFEKYKGEEDQCLKCHIGPSCSGEQENLCDGLEGFSAHTLTCISATKIQPEPKMYHAVNKDEATHLIGKRVEWFDGVSFIKGKMTKILDGLVVFEIDSALSATLIREIPTTKLTLAKLIEMAGIEGDVEIVEEGEL